MLAGTCQLLRETDSSEGGRYASNRPGPSLGHGDLDSALGYAFHNRELCDQALRHSSVGGGEFQRLEYLGDAALSLAVALFLYQRHGDWDEGQLTLGRSALVHQGYLIEVAKRIALDAHLRVSEHFGPLDRQAGSHPVLADAFEALIGAVVLDGGMAGVLAVVEHLFDEQELDQAAHPKSSLQEWLQARGLTLPEYKERSREGAIHAPHFEVECQLRSPPRSFIGSGRSLKMAETEAARRALEYLQSKAHE